MLAELLGVFLTAFFKEFGAVFLQWRQEQDAQNNARSLGRKEVESAAYEDAAQQADKIGGIAARPADVDYDVDRLRDGTA